MSALPPPPSMTNPGVPDGLQLLRLGLAEHPLYSSLSTIEDLRYFMERHVVCVWDFMSLLKSLQSSLTCTTWPWTPPLSADAARLVNEIVLGEESDEIAPGVHRSHFEWYLEAMEEVGANRAPMDRLVSSLRAGVHWSEALETARLPKEAGTFAHSTLRFAAGPLHVRAAAFFHGREALIPVMFVELVERLRSEGHPCGTLNAYLDRHVEVDGGEHGPMAERLLEALIGQDPTRAAEAEQAALASLRARHQLWNAILAGLPRRAAESRTRRSLVRSFWREEA